MNLPLLPSLLVTTQDDARIEALLRLKSADCRHGQMQDVLGFLRDELARADLIEPEQIPANVVTMNSRVIFDDPQRLTRSEVTLVYPSFEDIRRDMISVLSPVGSALIGLSEGQQITWQLGQEPWRSLRVVKVTDQPETRYRTCGNDNQHDLPMIIPDRGLFA